MTRHSRPVVVDASVAVKWLIPEPDWEQAVQVFDLAPALHAPELMQLEVANVLWKRVRAGEISQAEAETALAELRAIPLELFPDASLAIEALRMACLADCSVYDGIYVALACRSDAVMVTADERLVAAVSGGPLSSHIALLADYVRAAGGD